MLWLVFAVLKFCYNKEQFYILYCSNWCRIQINFNSQNTHTFSPWCFTLSILYNIKRFMMVSYCANLVEVQMASQITSLTILYATIYSIWWCGKSVRCIYRRHWRMISWNTYESSVTKCTTGKAWCAFSWHGSGMFLPCQWKQSQVFLLLSRA